MIKVIAIDLGGVLFSDGKMVAMETLARRGYDPYRIKALLSSDPARRLRAGLISDDDFWRWVQVREPSFDVTLIKKTWYESYTPDNEIWQLLDTLKGYTLIAFSGNIRSRVDYLEQKYSFRNLFTKEVYSFDEHANKSDPAFFQALLRVAGVSPDEIFYIDDKREFIHAAAALGITGTVYSHGRIEELKKELRAAGITTT